MRNFKLGYKSGGSRNYLCVETEEEISSYQLKMLEANEIPGLLRVHGTKLNGEYCFRRCFPRRTIFCLIPIA